MAGALFHDQAADDTAFLNLRFADGRLGQVTSLGYRDGAVTYAMQLVCEGGVIAIDLDRGVRVGQGAPLVRRARFVGAGRHGRRRHPRMARLPRRHRRREARARCPPPTAAISSRSSRPPMRRTKAGPRAAVAG